MGYFQSFPEIEYRFCGCSSTDNKVVFTNIAAYSDVFDQITDDSSLYRYYQVKNGERPDVVSQKLYGSTDYYWTFFLLNPKLRVQGWSLSPKQLEEKMTEALPGECLVFLPQDEVYLGPTNDFKQHPLVDNFNIGDDVFGQVSGARGVVYGRNVNLGQLFVKKVNDIPFQRNEVVVDRIGSAPSSQLTTRIVHNPAWDAIHHIEDGDGDHVDVDYALDFRGRGSELDPENVSGLPDGAGPGPDGNYIGGAIGYPEAPDVYSSGYPYTVVSFRGFYERANDDLSRIKVLKRGAAEQFIRLHSQSLKGSRNV